MCNVWTVIMLELFLTFSVRVVFKLPDVAPCTSNARYTDESGFTRWGTWGLDSKLLSTASLGYYVVELVSRSALDHSPVLLLLEVLRCLFPTTPLWNSERTSNLSKSPCELDYNPGLPEPWACALSVFWSNELSLLESSERVHSSNLLLWVFLFSGLGRRTLFLIKQHNVRHTASCGERPTGLCQFQYHHGWY